MKPIGVCKRQSTRLTATKNSAFPMRTRKLAWVVYGTSRKGSVVLDTSVAGALSACSTYALSASSIGGATRHRGTRGRCATRVCRAPSLPEPLRVISQQVLDIEERRGLNVDLSVFSIVSRSGWIWSADTNGGGQAREVSRFGVHLVRRRLLCSRDSRDRRAPRRACRRRACDPSRGRTPE